MKDKFNMIGSPLEHFSLPTSRETVFSSEDLMGQKNMVIVLLRDLRWPYCRAHVGRLRIKYDYFTELDTEIVPILVDKLGNAKEMEMKYAKGKFPILYDEKNQVAKKLNQQVKILKLGRLPGLLIVDKSGIIRYAYYSDNMKDIPKNADILEILSHFKWYT